MKRNLFLISLTLIIEIMLEALKKKVYYEK